MSISREIDEKINIVDLVSKYLSIKKAGVNYKALCPFHNEKTPSFVISPTKNIAYCFSCHNGGGPIKFLSEIEKIPYGEAMQKLAKDAGVELKTDFYKERGSNTGDIYDIYKICTDFYHNELYKEENKDKLEYLYKRGLKDETIKKFKIGYSFDPRSLFYSLTEKGFKEKEIIESGVFVSSNKDKFFGRIIFPISNYSGDTVAFTARVIDNSLPKYINSPATRIFDKSSILFGLNLAKQEISKKDFILIVEGQMDVISLHQAGFTNSVAISGTALTEEHTKLLKRLTKNIYFCLDNDSAGITATFSSIENLINEEVNIKIIDLDNFKDADEFLKSGNNFSEKIEKAMSLIEFYIKQGYKKYDINSVQGKKSMIKDLLRILKKINSKIELDFYIREISSFLGIGTDILYQELNQIKEKSQKTEEIKEKRGYSILEQIGGYLVLYDYFDLFFEKFKYNEADIEGENFSKTLIKLLKAKNTYIEDDSIDIDFIKSIELFIEEENLTLDKKSLEKKFFDLVKILNKNIFENKKNLLEERIKNDSKNDSLIIDYMSLIKEAKSNGII